MSAVIPMTPICFFIRQPRRTSWHFLTDHRTLLSVLQNLFNPPFIIAILIALTVHEWAHALVADRLGDPTPRSEGRLTLNPVAHLDPVGTLLFFLVSFGWGKPVPVNPRYFKHYKRDSALTAIAGPISNLILAILALVFINHVLPLFMHVGSTDRVGLFFSEVFFNLVLINLSLMAFNLLPIAPLDGSKVLEAFIPLRHEDAYHRFMQRGPMILLGILILERAFNIPILAMWMSAIVQGVIGVMMRVI